jgi:hexosaminidase
MCITKPFSNLVARYTLDGSLPNANSAVLDKPYIIKQSQKVRLAAFRYDGTRGDVYNLQYLKQNLAEPDTAKNVSKGLICHAYKRFYRLTTYMPDTKPDAVFKVDSITVPREAEAPSFGLKYRGYLNIPKDGIYSFYLTCDDGGVLRIANREVVNNDGLHAAIEKNGQLALKKGLQSFALDFIEGGGGYKLQLKYSVNGTEPKDIPSDWLKN